MISVFCETPHGKKSSLDARISLISDRVQSFSPERFNKLNFQSSNDFSAAMINLGNNNLCTGLHTQTAPENELMI
jgi:hypothetical protein